MLDYFNEEVQKQQNIVLRQDERKKNIWYIYECDAGHNPIEPPKRVLKYIPLTESNLELPQLYLRLQATNHPNLVRIYEVVRQGNQFALEMEYVDGDTIEEVMEKYCTEEDTCIGVKGCLQVAIQICDGLQVFHDAGYIHRDISCNNVMIWAERGQEWLKVKLIDYEGGHKTDTSKSRDTVCFGTPGYAAPEQWGYAPTDPTTDIYAIGKIILKMQTQSEQESTVDAIGDETLRRIVKKCIRKDKEERYQDIRFLKSELQRYYNQKYPSEPQTKNLLWGSFQEYMTEEYGHDMKNVFLQKPEPIPIPINVVIGITLFILIPLCWIVPGFALFMILLFGIPYSRLVGWYFRRELEKMEFYYPFPQDLRDISDKLYYDFMKSGITFREHSNTELEVKIKRRKYIVNFYLDEKVIMIHQEHDRYSIRVVRNMQKDFGVIVYMIQHVNSF